VPYLQKLPFPAIAIIVTLIIINAVVWAAVGVVLVSYATKQRCCKLTSTNSTGTLRLYPQRFCLTP
jgi:hypothetical protein